MGAVFALLHKLDLRYNRKVALLLYQTVVVPAALMYGTELWGVIGDAAHAANKILGAFWKRYYGLPMGTPTIPLLLDLELDTVEQHILSSTIPFWNRATQLPPGHAFPDILQGDMLSQPGGRGICWGQRWTQIVGDSRIQASDSLSLKAAVQQGMEAPRQLVPNILSLWPKALASQFSGDPTHPTCPARKGYKFFQMVLCPWGVQCSRGLALALATELVETQTWHAAHLS